MWFTCAHASMPLHVHAAKALKQQYNCIIIEDCNLPANNGNMFDSIGLNYYNFMQLLDKEITYDSEISYQNILLTSFNQKNDCTPLQATILSDTAINIILQDAPNNYTNILSKSFTNTSVKIFANRLFNIIQNITDNNGRYCSIKQAIITLEKDILQNIDTNYSERKKILEACSIARFSLYYWSKKLATANVPLGKFKLFRWQAICMGTIASSIVGNNKGDTNIVSIYSAVASKKIYDSTEPK